LCHAVPVCASPTWFRRGPDPASACRPRCVGSRRAVGARPPPATPRAPPRAPMREEAPSELQPALARLRLCPSMHVLPMGRHRVRTVPGATSCRSNHGEKGMARRTPILCCISDTYVHVAPHLPFARPVFGVLLSGSLYRVAWFCPCDSTLFGLGTDRELSTIPPKIGEVQPQVNLGEKSAKFSNVRRCLAKVFTTPPVRWRVPLLVFQATSRMWLSSKSAISTHSERNV
jgi:hypothetical protein